jgi:hypothetical protein
MERKLSRQILIRVGLAAAAAISLNTVPASESQANSSSQTRSNEQGLGVLDPLPEGPNNCGFNLGDSFYRLRRLNHYNQDDQWYNAASHTYQERSSRAWAEQGGGWIRFYEPGGGPNERIYLVSCEQVQTRGRTSIELRGREFDRWLNPRGRVTGTVLDENRVTLITRETNGLSSNIHLTRDPQQQ